MKIFLYLFSLIFLLSIVPGYAAIPIKEPVAKYSTVSEHKERSKGRVAHFFEKIHHVIYALHHQPNGRDKGTLALVFGILGLVVFPLFSIPALIIGSKYKRVSANARAGFILGIIGCAIALLYLLIAILVLILLISV